MNFEPYTKMKIQRALLNFKGRQLTCAGVFNARFNLQFVGWTVFNAAPFLKAPVAGGAARAPFTPN